MLILGIDPSLRNTGLAILDTDAHKLIYTRTIRPLQSDSLQVRLHHTYKHIRELLRNTPIKRAAIETPYFGKYSTALKVAMAYGVCLCACEDAGVVVSHYSPACVKKNATGIGSAHKNMVIHAIELIYGIKGLDSHMADAAALAHVDHQFI